MNWDMITAMVALIGAIAIVAALLYLTGQMKAASRQRRIEWHHAVLAEMDGFCELMAHDHANSDIWWRASKGIENLTDVERVRYFAMLFILFRSWEKAFRYHNEGELEDWSADAVTKPMVDFAMSNGVQEYWALRKRWYAADFRDWVDTRMKERSGVDPYGEQFRIFGSVDTKRVVDPTAANE
jgi:hypothetical protein